MEDFEWEEWQDGFFENYNGCKGCINYEEWICYFESKICKICSRNPWVDNDKKIFVSKNFIFLVPTDMYLPGRGFNKDSIGFLVRFGKIKLMMENVSKN